MSKKKPPVAEAQPNFIVWLYRSVDDWFYGKGSPITLGVFRAVMSGLIFISLLMLIPSFHDWYSDNGYVPKALGGFYFDSKTDLYGLQVYRINLFGIEVPRFNVFGFSFLGFSVGPGASLAIFAGTALTSFLAALGIWTRATTILMAIGIISLHHRNGLVLHGGDTLSRVCAMYLAIAPSGAGFSLDRFFAVRKGKAPDIPNSISLWPQRLIQIQVAIIYFTSTWHKWTGHHWRQGDAVWYPLNLNEFDRFPVPAFAYSKPMILLATYGTLVAQLAMATLVFHKPLRKYALVAGAGLHLSIDYSMNIPLFSYLMIATYITFYDGEEIASWWDRLREKRFKYLGSRTRVFAQDENL